MKTFRDYDLEDQVEMLVQEITLLTRLMQLGAEQYETGLNMAEFWDTALHRSKDTVLTRIFEQERKQIGGLTVIEGGKTKPE